MRLQPRTLDRLTGVITGDGGPYPYRGGPKIIAFFSALGWDDSYGPSFGSRSPHTREKLDALHGMYHPAPYHAKLVVNGASSTTLMSIGAPGALWRPLDG